MRSGADIQSEETVGLYPAEKSDSNIQKSEAAYRLGMLITSPWSRLPIMRGLVGSRQQEVHETTHLPFWVITWSRAQQLKTGEANSTHTHTPVNHNYIQDLSSCKYGCYVVTQWICVCAFWAATAYLFTLRTDDLKIKWNYIPNKANGYAAINGTPFIRRNSLLFDTQNSIY